MTGICINKEMVISLWYIYVMQYYKGILKIKILFMDLFE